MKVLFILTGIPGFKGRGECSFNAIFIEELIRKGVAVTVIRLRSISPFRSLCSRTLLDSNIPCITICAFLPPVFSRPIFLPSLFAYLFQRLNLDYDMVHAGNGGVAIAAAIAARLKKVEYIIQFIGSDVNTDLVNLIRSKRYLTVLNGAKLHTFESAKLLEVFNSLHHNSTVKSDVIRRGVRLWEFSFNYNLGEEIIIAFLGGTPKGGDEKGFFTVVEAIRILNLLPIESNMRIIIGGLGTLKYKDSLNITNTKINVQFVGVLTRSEVIKLLNDSNIVLIPSLNEGIPNVLCEAMASGNMVIASDVGGISEVLEDGISGWLIRPGRPDELADAISKAIAIKNQLIEYAKNGRAIVEKLDNDIFVSSYVRNYKTVTGLEMTKQMHKDFS